MENPQQEHNIMGCPIFAKVPTPLVLFCLTLKSDIIYVCSLACKDTIIPQKMQKIITLSGNGKVGKRHPLSAFRSGPIVAGPPKVFYLILD